MDAAAGKAATLDRSSRLYWPWSISLPGLRDAVKFFKDKHYI